MKSSEKSQLVKNIVSGSLRFEDRYVADKTVLSGVVKILKDAGYRVVLTQGVYDLFHTGHKRYLENAKGEGDILIVGVDSDELTRKRKGPGRPFDTLSDRLEILSGMRAIDILTVRNHDEHMYDLIKLVKPDVLIMSQTTEDFKEKDRLSLLKYCGEIKVLPSQSSTTTTAKVRRMMTGGAEQLGRRVTDLINEFLKGINNTNEISNPLSSGSTQRTPRILSKAKARHSLRSRKKSNK